MSDDVTTRTAAPRPLAVAPRAAALALAAAVLVPALAGAQDVGYRPEESPYRDVPYRQEMTLFAGYYAAGKDPEGVAPRSGPMVGARYEIRIGGPAQFFARAGLVRTERRAINPLLPPPAQELGIRDVNLLLADVGVSLNVTGQKSWHGLMPVLAGGLGIASDLASRDEGGFRLGTPFAITVGGGVRWVGGGNLQLRVDLTDHVYQVKYPSTYYLIPAAGVPPVRASGEKQNVWKHNAALTVGASYLFFR